jgi:hypothetical protein
MSDFWLRYVPKEPGFRPNVESVAMAERLLRTYLPDAESVKSEEFEHVTFIDSGGNWAGVFCPSCGADAKSWWGTAMSEAHETQFARMDIRTPCCGAATSLNELRYGWPCGFGVYVLEALNPNVQGLNRQQLAALSGAVGHPMLEVQRHI